MAEVAPPAPEPAEDVADEKAAVPSPEESKALVVAESTAVKLLADITSWENSKAAEMEAELKKMQEQLEKKKARCVEKLKNSAATVRRRRSVRRPKRGAARRSSPRRRPQPSTAPRARPQRSCSSGP
uniref:Remorin C-terminal domain-containing protein n=1 Tax=Hordeum vulgare subsp. vulgare TaxID=112509 RepID=A0A8I6WI01_HORVV